VHNLHIVKNTPLERMYRANPFPLFGFGEYVDFIVEFLERLSPDMVVERLFTDTPRQLLVAPDWGKSHIQVMQAIEAELEKRDTFQGRLCGSGDIAASAL
jgi:radical SAM superfamily enzyme